MEQESHAMGLVSYTVEVRQRVPYVFQSVIVSDNIVAVGVSVSPRYLVVAVVTASQLEMQAEVTR